MALARLLATLALITVSMIAPQASAQWAPNGVPVCTAVGPQDHLAIVSDEAGGAIFAWSDQRETGNAPGRPYVQRLDTAGIPQWTTDGQVLCDSCDVGFFTHQTPLVCVPDGAGGAIVVWPMFHILTGQRIDGSGATLWGPLEVAHPWNLIPRSWGIPDGTGGAIIGWDWVPPLDLYYMGSSTSHVTSAGALLFYDEGIAHGGRFVSLSAGAPDSAGGAIVGWINYGSDPYGDYVIQANRYDPSAARQWGNNTYIDHGTYSDPELTAVADGQGGAWFAWSEFTFWERIHARRVDGAGGAIPIAVVSTVGTPQIRPVPVADGSGGVIVAWEDLRSGASDIYIQRLDGAGQRLWMDEGVPISTASGSQTSPRMIEDGVGGAIVAWTDHRWPTSDVYAQRVNASGETLWSLDGVVICNAPGNQDQVDIVSDGAGGAIIAWQDERGLSSDIYAQRVTAEGIVNPVVSVAERSPVSFRLSAPKPNPVRASTTISFELPQPRRVSIEVYGVDGRLVRRLADGQRFPAGRSEVVWDGSGAAGRVTPGLYLVRARAGNESAVSKIVTMN